MTSETTKPSKQPDNPLAVAAMVCGALSLTGAGLFLGIPALILGIVALKNHDNGRNLSIAGIVTGAISTLLSILVILFFIWLIVWGPPPTLRPQPPLPATPSYDSSRV